MAYDDEYKEEYQDDENYGPPIRCCERCGAGDLANKPPAMCHEVQLAFGMVSWICYDCRKSWFRYFKTHDLQCQYSDTQMELEFWRAGLGPNAKETLLSEGLTILHTVNDLELKINEVANQWMISDS